MEAARLVRSIRIVKPGLHRRLKRMRSGNKTFIAQDRAFVRLTSYSTWPEGWPQRGAKGTKFKIPPAACTDDFEGSLAPVPNPVLCAFCAPSRQNNSVWVASAEELGAGASTLKQSDGKPSHSKERGVSSQGGSGGASPSTLARAMHEKWRARLRPSRESF